MATDRCRLCNAESELQLSHILPAFTYRWVRESSANGFLRGAGEPNKRVQDGLKRPWLCAACEQLFSRSETAFAGKLFHPFLAKPGRIYPYSNWLLRFCTSVSWRVLRFYRDEIKLSSWDEEALQRVECAESAWREYLLGLRRHPGEYQQHLLPFDEIASASEGFPPNMNRYLMRAIDMDICRGNSAIFTYAKLGRFAIFGFIHEPQMDRWRGTRVHANNGFIEPKKFVIPRALADYLGERARHASNALDSVSARQHAKIDTAFRNSASEFVGSDAFNAMQADIRLYGDDAFSKKS